MHNLFKEFLSELCGTAILMIVGISGCACNVLRSSPINLEGGFGYAFGVVIAIVVTGPVSGAHINPAVTVALTVIGKFKWQKVPVYLVAQYLGSFLGSFLSWGIYSDSIRAFEIKQNLTSQGLETASMFITMPADKITLWPAILDQVVSTALLIIAILFILDQSIAPSSTLLQALTVGFVVLTFIIGFSYNCGAILNPARDLGPRVLLWWIGYKDLPFRSMNGHFWWSVGIISPHIGAIIGAIFFHYFSNMRIEFALENQPIKEAIDDGPIKTKSMTFSTARENQGIVPKVVSNRQVVIE